MKYHWYVTYEYTIWYMLMFSLFHVSLEKHYYYNTKTVERFRLLVVIKTATSYATRSEPLHYFGCPVPSQPGHSPHPG